LKSLPWLNPTTENVNRTFYKTLCLLLLAGGWAQTGLAQNKTNAPAATPRAIFVLPVSVRDGRDPFFPESIRTVAEAAPNSTSFDLSSLKCPGVSGTPGHLFAIINNHTFAVGDEGDVVTPSGRVHLRCLDINSELVTVEINGQIHRIRLLTP
jgi:hypothetical protein